MKKTRKINDKEAYRAVLAACKTRRNGATVADIVGGTSLPLETVKELLPKVSDEYAGRLQVTDSGEILYSFPRGFKSKYSGFGVFLRNVVEKAVKGLKIFASWLFKVWIMLMLVGYFALFMLIALGALVLSLSGGSSNSDSRSNRGGGAALVGGIFDLIIRLWFYSTIVKSLDPAYRGRQTAPKGKPLHKAIFSFVFGDGDPNADWGTREKRAVIAYIQANKGVIALPEFIVLTGLKQFDAERAITTYCAEFGGSPEATDDGTVVYRFDALMLRADVVDRSFGGSSPVKRLEAFSSNKKNMNVWFCVLNGVNTIFGGYFLYNAAVIGAVGVKTFVDHGRKISQFVSMATGEAASYIYGFTYTLLAHFTEKNPLTGIAIGLGLVPLTFSALFWLVPFIRARGVKRRNETIKLENLRKIAFNRVWESPRNVKSADFTANTPEVSPVNLPKAQDKLIKEIGTYSQPDVSVDNSGETLYTFPEIEREKTALGSYRAGVRNADLGRAVFDSDS